jgi:hypothetical protein
MSELVESVSRKQIPAYAKFLVFEIMVNDTEGEDVRSSYTDCHRSRLSQIEVPFVQLR